MSEQTPHAASPFEQLTRWLAVGSSIVAPATLITTMLFYFGYVSSRAEFRYFGLDVDAIGLSTNDFVMRSPQVLLAPLLAVALAAIALLLMHVRLRRHPPSTRAVSVGVLLALTVLATGLLFVLAYGWLGEWQGYALATPLLIGTGTAVLAYTFWMATAPEWLRRSHDDRARWVRPGVTALALVVVATCLFWATATLAQWTGRGNAKQTARHLDALPAVILDTKERLFLTDGIVEESVLPGSSPDGFRFRYRGLRLLIQGEGHMYLVPYQWSPSNSTLAIAVDGGERVQFRFENQAP